MELIGKIKVIKEVNQVSEKYKKRELVVTTDEQYPQSILVEFAQDKCDLLNNFKVGQEVKIGINLRGREWINPQGEAKYFNTIQGWSIFDSQSKPKEKVQDHKNVTPVNFTGEKEDDLPFQICLQ